jgi:hypothetical protein
MALNRENLIALARANAKASLNPSTTFSVEGQELSKSAINTKFIDELNKLGKNPHDFSRNKELIYELLEVGITEVMPTKVLQNYGQFADVQTFAQGTKPIFKLKISEASKKRAKSFVTRVGLAGRYETFKLDGYQFEVPTSAYGGAARVEWEELLDGNFSMNDYYSLVLEGMDEAVYKEIAKALESMIINVPGINKTAQTTFDEGKMDHLIWTADAYGKSTIYCTFEFAATMLPQVNGGATNWSAMSDNMKEQIWNNGYFATYKGHNVIILPQSFEDETNATKVINPANAYIIPTGSEKPVKVAFEGAAQVKSFENRDWSTEIQTYQKLGIATYLVNPGICVYTNSSLKKSNAWNA